MHYIVPNVRCLSCFRPLKEALNQKFELEEVIFNPIKKKISIHISDKQYSKDFERELFKFLKDRGYSTQRFSDLFQGLLGTTVGLIIILASLLFSPLPLVVCITIALLSTTLTIALGSESYKKAWMELQERKFSMDSLFAISSMVTIVVSWFSFFVPWLPMMFDTGLLIFGFRHLGQVIEESLAHATDVDMTFTDRLPKVISVRRGDHTFSCALNHVEIDDEIELSPGDIIPLNGLCLNEENAIDETILNGSSLPRRVKRGEKLLSGTKVANTRGKLLLKVTDILANSHLSQLDKALENAILAKEKVSYQTEADKILTYFIPMVFMAAGISGLVASYFFPFDVAIRCALGVLVSACPCTLGLVVPLAVQIGMRKAQLHGVSFKNTQELELTDTIDRVVFDLNGTLTTGDYQIKKESISLCNLSSFYGIIAALEKEAEHPIGRFLYLQSQAKTNENKMAYRLLNCPYGINGTINNENYFLGDESHMKSEGIEVSPISDLEPGDIPIYLAKEKNILGCLILANPIRPESYQVVRNLKNKGKEVYICTGGSQSFAIKAAKALGVSESHVCAKTKRKDEYIQQLQANHLHRVAMVGDGANDVLAIAASDFALAIGSKVGDSLAQKKAIFIESSSLFAVVTAFDVSHQTIANIKQNLALNLGYNVLVALLMGGGFASCGLMINPSLGVVLMMAQMTLILGNAWRFQIQGVDHFVTEKPLLQNQSPSSNREALADIKNFQIGRAHV